MRSKSFRYFYVAAVLLFFGNLLGSCLVFLQVHDTTHFYFVNPLPYLRQGNVECYKTRNENTANITSANFFAIKSIYFHSLWCDKIIDEAGACAIESAARLHPQTSINLIFACAVSKDTWSKHLDVLIKLPNFRLIGMQIGGYANGTEFEKIWQNFIAHDKITNPKEVAEYVKLLSLHRFGGIVLDLDVIVNKPLDTLGNNWVVKSGERIFETDAISIPPSDVGRNVTAFALRTLSRQILQKEVNASIALGNALINLCPKHNFTASDNGTCYILLLDKNIKHIEAKPVRLRNTLEDIEMFNLADFAIYNESTFHPISRDNWEQYYSPGDYDKDAYAHRLWDDEHPDIVFSHQTMYGNLAKAFCPWIFSRSTDGILE